MFGGSLNHLLEWPTFAAANNDGGDGHDDAQDEPLFPSSPTAGLNMQSNNLISS